MATPARADASPTLNLNGPRKASATPLPGVVGEYEILGELGRGGMGVVYKARHLKLGRVVALKVTRDHLASAGDALRFHQEAAAVARLDHPNIVPVYEAGEADGRPFFSMALVEGRSLAQAAPLPPRQAAALMREVASAIAYAHARGVVHRDIKPENILLDGEGRPRVTDFGVAKFAGADSLLTQDGKPVGTPSYMPPEQAQGLADQVGPLSDVYSLGATLYYLLTGRPPFRAASALETMKQLVELEPAPPRSLNPAVDRDLETICLKCLHKDPRKRYPSADDLANDLGRFLDGRPIQARPVGPAEKLLRWGRRNPLPALALAGTAAAVLAAFALMSWSHARVTAALREEASQRAAAVRHEQAERWERYLANIALAASALQTGNVAAARRSLEAAPQAYRDWEWRHFHQQFDRSRRVFESDGPHINRVAFLGDGLLIEQPGRLRLFPADAPHLDLSSVGPVRAFSPTGDALAYQRGREVVIRGPSGSERVLTGTFDGPLTHLCFSSDGARLDAWPSARRCRSWGLVGPNTPDDWHIPDGNRLDDAGHHASPLLLAHDEGRGVIRVLCRETRRYVALIAGHTGNVVATLFNRDASRLVTAEGYPSNLLRMWDPRTGRQLALLAGHTNQAQYLLFSPDGSRFASCSYDQTARLWDGRTGAHIATLAGHSGRVMHAAFSPDGKRLVTGSQDRTIRLWDAQAGGLIAPMYGHSGDVYALAYSPDGRRIASASADGTARLWDVPLVERNGILSGHKSFVYGIAWHPDGRGLASASWDNTVRRWDADTGRQTAELAAGAHCFHPAYSPSGGLLAALCRDDSVRLWDAEGHLLHRWRLPTDHWQDGRLVFSPDGALLAAGCTDGAVRLLDVAGRSEAGVLRGLRTPIHGVAFSPDGRWLAAGATDDSSGVRVWDVARREPRVVLGRHAEGVAAVAWSPDGTLLATASAAGMVRLWRPATWEEVGEMRHGTGIYSIAFHPDGRRLASGCADGSVRLWDVARRQEVVELLGHKTYVHSVAFSPDGTRLATGSGDFTVRVWDTLTPVERAARR